MLSSVWTQQGQEQDCRNWLLVQEVAQEPVELEINNGHLEEGEDFALAKFEEEATSTDQS